MSGPVVNAVRRAIAVEVREGHRHQLALDRMWMWNLTEVEAPRRSGIALAATNHFLAAHRDARRTPPRGAGGASSGVLPPSGNTGGKST